MKNQKHEESDEYDDEEGEVKDKKFEKIPEIQSTELNVLQPDNLTGRIRPPTIWKKMLQGSTTVDARLY